MDDVALVAIFYHVMLCMALNFKFDGRVTAHVRIVFTCLLIEIFKPRCHCAFFCICNIGIVAQLALAYSAQAVACYVLLSTNGLANEQAGISGCDKTVGNLLYTVSTYMNE